MHRVLCLEEVLLNIFGHFHYSDSRSLANVARTCRKFKEPALDVLWDYLADLTPLVRCLPKSVWVFSGGVYSFSRHLEEAEWRIILGYTRRVRGLRLDAAFLSLASECVRELSKPPSFTASIFPRLSFVQLIHFIEDFAPFIQYLLGPRLKRLDIRMTADTASDLRDAIDAFGKGCLNVTDFNFMTSRHFSDTYVDAISEALCQWTKLTFVDCWDISFTVEALFHLSQCNMRYFSFCPDGAVDYMQSTPSTSPTLTFSTLPELGLSSRSIASVGRFLDHVRFPGLQILYLVAHGHPTMLAIASFFSSLQGACGYDALHSITLEAKGWKRDNEGEDDHEDWVDDENNSESDEDEANRSSDVGRVRDSPQFFINFDSTSPLTAFRNIRSIVFDTPSHVDLNEQQLILLASSWPRLEVFDVGNGCDWSTPSAITPAGFLQLLERCRSLRSLSVMLDTRGYKEVPQGHPWRGMTMPIGISISLLHSTIEEESVEPLSVFFHVAPHPHVRLTTHWDDQCSGLPYEVCDLYFERWTKVFSLARDMYDERRKLRSSLETRLSQPDVGMNVAMRMPTSTRGSFIIH